MTVDNGNEDLARAVGARTPEPFIIKGIEVKPRPLTVRDIAELQRACRQHYIRHLMQAKRENVDLVYDDKAEQQAYLRSELDRLSAMDVDDLPARLVYSIEDTKFSAEADAFFKDKVPAWHETLKKQTKIRLLSYALDSETVTKEDIERLKVGTVRSLKTSYVNWWVGATQEGMIEMIWQMVQDSGDFTKKDLEEEFTHRQSDLANAARSIEEASAPSGNG